MMKLTILISNTPHNHISSISKLGSFIQAKLPKATMVKIVITMSRKIISEFKLTNIGQFYNEFETTALCTALCVHKVGNANNLKQLSQPLTQQNRSHNVLQKQTHKHKNLKCEENKFFFTLKPSLRTANITSIMYWTRLSICASCNIVRSLSNTAANHQTQLLITQQNTITFKSIKLTKPLQWQQPVAVTTRHLHDGQCLFWPGELVRTWHWSHKYFHCYPNAATSVHSVSVHIMWSELT